MLSRRAWAVVGAMLALSLASGPLPAEQGDTVGDAASPEESTQSTKSTARDYLEFSNTLNSDCMLHRARLRRIENTHPDRSIRVVLVSYTGKTRSQGDSELLLQPKSEPQPLGCDGTSGLKRRWEIVSVRFES